MTAKTDTQNSSWIKVTAKVIKQKLKISAESAYRERQLLLTLEIKDIAVNSLAYRNAINNALKTAKVENVLVLTVTVSRTDASIVVTTVKENTAEDLLKHRAVWESQLNLNLTQVRKNSKWYEIILHKLFTAVFNTAQELKMLKEEVKLFNKEINLVTESVWLLIEKNR